MKLKNGFILLLTATIWGVAFVAQSVGGNVGTFTFNATRSILAFLFLFLLVKIMHIDLKKKEWIAGITCGICLFIAMTFQQYGVMLSTVGKSGFITAFYILLVPILGIFLHQKFTLRMFISVLIALVGLYLLCMNESMTIQLGDIYLLACAFFFALHILVIDHFVKSVEPVAISCIQFLMVSIISGILMMIFESPSISSLTNNYIPILYAGILSSGVAYTLQMVGQKDMNPTIASMILSLESAISVIAGFLILHQSLSLKEGIGCIFMMIAIILIQL